MFSKVSVLIFSFQMRHKMSWKCEEFYWPNDLNHIPPSNENGGHFPLLLPGATLWSSVELKGIRPSLRLPGGKLSTTRSTCRAGGGLPLQTLDVRTEKQSELSYWLNCDQEEKGLLVSPPSFIPTISRKLRCRRGGSPEPRAFVFPWWMYAWTCRRCCTADLRTEAFLSTPTLQTSTRICIFQSGLHFHDCLCRVSVMHYWFSLFSPTKTEWPSLAPR